MPLDFAFRLFDEESKPDCTFSNVSFLDGLHRYPISTFSKSKFISYLLPLMKSLEWNIAVKSKKMCINFYFDTLVHTSGYTFIRSLLNFNSNLHILRDDCSRSLEECMMDLLSNRNSAEIQQIWQRKIGLKIHKLFTMRSAHTKHWAILTILVLLK